MRRPLLMMKTRGLLGPAFGRFAGARASHPLAKSGAGNAQITVFGCDGSGVLTPFLGLDDDSGSLGILQPRIYDGEEIERFAGTDTGAEAAQGTIALIGGVQFPSALVSFDVTFEDATMFTFTWDAGSSQYLNAGTGFYDYLESMAGFRLCFTFSFE